MKFETKFNIDETAWIMKDNKPVEVIVSAIEIFEVKSNQSQIKYNARNARSTDGHPTNWLDHQNLLETQMFKSKDDLSKSLFNK